MELAVSILDIKDDIDTNKKIELLNNLNVNYLHIDVMDGIFVPKISDNFEKMQKDLINNKKLLDVHLMVNDVKFYIDKYKKLKPKYITFHYEINDDINSIINFIKANNISVGMSVKPSTDVSLLIPYLDKLDLVLIMTVEPGMGGQKFMDDMVYKINKLLELKKKSNYHFKVEVDGGINNDTIQKVKNTDIIVVGSYITHSNNYEQSIKKIMGE